MPPTNAAAYAGITEAKTETRFPFLKGPARILCSIDGWRFQVNRKSGNADVTDFKVERVFRGHDLYEVGQMGSRMRMLDVDGMGLKEIKQRLQVALTVAAGGAEVNPASITPAVIGDVTGANGGGLRGLCIVLDIQPETIGKNGKPFTAINYFVPTAADMEGVTVGAPAAPAAPSAPVVPTPAQPAPVAAAPEAPVDDFDALLALGWSEAEINTLDDTHFTKAVEGKVQRTSVTLAADGKTFTVATARRQRVA